MDNINALGNYTDSHLINSKANILNMPDTISSAKDATQNAPDSHPQFNNGDRISGEIVDLRNDEIKVRLSDDTVIHAKTLNKSNLNIGDVVTFNVKNTTQGLTLEPVNIPTSTETVIIDKALMEANLPKNIKNITIIQELLKNNMAINKQNIVNVLSQSYANKDISISTLVLMNKQGIPVTKENAVGMQNYYNNEHRIVTQISSIVEEISSIIANEQDTHKVININKDIVNILTSYPSIETDSNPLLSTSFTTANDKSDIINILSQFGINDELLTKIENNTATLRETAIAINKAYEYATVMDLEQDYDSSYSYTLSNSLTQAKDLFANPAIENVLKMYSHLQNNNNEISSYMNDFTRATLNSMIKGLPGSQAFSDKIWSGAITSKETLQDLNNLISFMPADKAVSIIRSSEYLTLLKQTITGEWTLTPSDLKKTDNVDEKFKRIYEQIEKISDVSSKNTLTEAKLPQLSESLKSNIDFMNTLNQMFSYMQLPMRLSGQNIHSDLYVITNKKKLAKNNNSISVLLHLDMTYLNTMDIHINLNNNNIDAKFYMTDKTSKSLLETNMEHLELALLEKGFLFSSKVLDKKEDVDPVKNFLSDQPASTSLKRYSFDIRA